ncbi:MAG: TerC family protein [Planctomycetes bacterium]|nr:TerC family protein [Planctomycetota bacterium]
MDSLFTGENIVALLTLTLLEIVLGIDNIVFISILTGRVPLNQRARARTFGLALAMGTRILLLLGISWVMKLTTEFFRVAGHGFTGKDLVLLVGGAFLVAKATWEIHEKLEGAEHTTEAAGRRQFVAVLVQIALLDIVFSLDSVITAVGMVDDVRIMVVAVMIAVGVMMIFSGTVSRFIERHPTMKMLALSFLILIGVMLVAEGFGQHINKGYIYSAMAFSLLVEMMNMRMRRNTKPVQLHNVPSVQDGKDV